MLLWSRKRLLERKARYCSCIHNTLPVTRDLARVFKIQWPEGLFRDSGCQPVWYTGCYGRRELFCELSFVVEDCACSLGDRQKIRLCGGGWLGMKDSWLRRMT